MAQAAAVVDFGDVDVLRGNAIHTLPAALTTTTTPAPAPAPVPLNRPSRNRRRRGPKKLVAPSQADSSEAAGVAGMAAPWEVNEEAEAAEKKQELREALKKKLNRHKMARSNRAAFEARQERGSGAGAGASAGAGDDGGLGGMGMDLSKALGGVDSAALQALAAKMGVSPDQMPNRRKLERMLRGMSTAEMIARAGK